MRKTIFLLFALSALDARAACEPDVVHATHASMQGFGTWREAKQAADFRWRPQFDAMPAVARTTLMKQFANWDRCTSGGAREIDFYLDGKLIARTLADGRYQAVDKAFEAADGPQIKFWVDDRSK